MMYSKHSQKRMHQRSIPPIVNKWLDEFGEEMFDGHGGILVFFSKASIRKMETAFGHHFLAQNKKYLGVYRVESTDNSTLITTGWRTRRMTRH